MGWRLGAISSAMVVAVGVGVWWCGRGVRTVRVEGRCIGLGVVEGGKQAKPWEILERCGLEQSQVSKRFHIRATHGDVISRA